MDKVNVEEKMRHIAAIMSPHIRGGMDLARILGEIMNRQNQIIDMLEGNVKEEIKSDEGSDESSEPKKRGRKPKSEVTE